MYVYTYIYICMCIYIYMLLMGFWTMGINMDLTYMQARIIVYLLLLAHDDHRPWSFPQSSGSLTFSGSQRIRSGPQIASFLASRSAQVQE